MFPVDGNLRGILRLADRVSQQVRPVFFGQPDIDPVDITVVEEFIRIGNPCAARIVCGIRPGRNRRRTSEESRGTEEPAVCFSWHFTPIEY